MSAKSVISQVLSTATLASFAIPEVGVVVAAGTGVGQLLFDIFCPDAATDPSVGPATKTDLHKAVEDLAKIVEDTAWRVQIALNGNVVLGQNYELMENWGKLALRNLDTVEVPESSPGAGDGLTYLADEPSDSAAT